jgi:hypothetical protein
MAQNTTGSLGSLSVMCQVKQWVTDKHTSFILLGRSITVALGPKGNNLSLGGKVSQVSAEEAYTVSSIAVPGLERPSVCSDADGDGVL